MFALSLSTEGIQLLHRGSGGWRLVGDVALDSSDLANDLKTLRKAADELEPGGIRSKIILPNEQVRYLTVTQDSHAKEDFDAFVRSALDGATPYGVDDLVFDTCRDGDETHIAAVARETLAEAEAFALEHEFHPVCFAATPADAGFLGEPGFGLTKHAKTLMAPGETLDPDGVAIVIVGEAELPATSETDAPPEGSGDAPVVAVDTSSASPEPVAAPAPQTPQEAPLVAGFSSIRPARNGPLKDSAISPALSGASRDMDTPTAPNIPIPGAPPPIPAPIPAPIMPLPQENTAPDISGTPVANGGLADTEVPPIAHAAGSVDPPSQPEATSHTDGFLQRRTPTGIPAAPDRYEDANIDEPSDHTTDLDGPEPVKIGGKPRFLGLVLTAILLLFLAGVAAWASIFLDDGLTGLFKNKHRDSGVATVPQTLLPQDLQTSEPGATEAGAAPVDNVTLVSLAPDAEELTGIDTAVLDAMRQPVPAEEITLEQARTDYAATGIWKMAPDVPSAPGLVGLDDLYIASIDPVIEEQDAVALPPLESYLTDSDPGSFPAPTPSGTEFSLDARGLVIPTAAGALNPDGIVVYLGKPPVVPPPIPIRTNPAAFTEAVALTRLSQQRPRLRPADLVEQNERNRLGGLTKSELAGLRPRIRPEVEKVSEEVDQTPTKQAVASSRVPKPRPKDMDRIVQQANIKKAPQPVTVASAAAVAPPQTIAPKIPSSASVAKQATVKNAINLRRINLIGVYGKPSSRRALVRLANGRYKKVQVGDRIDGGRISAIGDGELHYVKGGRNVVLKMPKG